MSNISCHYYVNDGRFDICSNEQQTQCVLQVWGLDGEGSRIAISDIWDKGECPVDSDMLPSEVVEHIAAQLESYLYTSRRKEGRAKIETLRKHKGAIDAAWLRERIEDTKSQLAHLLKQLDEIEVVACETT